MVTWEGFDPSVFNISRLGRGYVLHYGHRSREGFRADSSARGQPVRLVPLNGVHGVEYVDAVAKALDQACGFYELCFRIPACGKDLFDVYLVNLAPVVDGLTFGVTPIVVHLRNRFEASQGPLVLGKLQAACAHETFHVYQQKCCPGTLANHSWAWWGEATAMYMENQVFPGNSDNLRFLFRSLDLPMCPVDWQASDPTADPADTLEGCPYGGMLLCEFLAERFGRDLICETWNSRARNAAIEHPMDSVSALLKPRRGEFGSVLHPDVFGSQFCLARYLLGNPKRGFKTHGATYAKVFGHVFVSAVHDLASGHVRYTSEARLYRLSAEYHIIELPRDRRGVNLRLECRGDSGKRCPVKGLVVCLKSDNSPVGTPKELILSSTADSLGYRGEIRVTPLKKDVADILLIVVNPTWGKNEATCHRYAIEARVL